MPVLTVISPSAAQLVMVAPTLVLGGFVFWFLLGPF